MYLSKVIGTVTASRKVDGLVGSKFLLVKAYENVHVAVDTVRAGEGDFVSCVGSREAALALEENFVPVDAAIVGIVDQVNREVS